MEKTKYGILKSAFCLMLAVVFIFSFAACGKKEEEEKSDIKQFGSGENNFYAVIVYGEEKTVYEIFTDSVTVGDGMEENGLIEMSDLPDGSGRYLASVDGKKADYENDRQYWSVSEGGAYASSDPYDVPIQCSQNYIFQIETAPQN